MFTQFLRVVYKPGVGIVDNTTSLVCADAEPVDGPFQWRAAIHTVVMCVGRNVVHDHIGCDLQAVALRLVQPAHRVC